MDDLLRRTLLYDFYGELLNAHQKNIYEQYLFRDLSLAEIALDQGISRQAVHDVIRRATKTLEEYEEKLKLLQRFQSIRTKVKEMEALLLKKEAEDTEKILSRIQEISQAIIEEL